MIRGFEARIAALRTQQTKLYELERVSLPAAKRADQETLAAAIRSGKGAPSDDVATATIMAAIAECKRQIGGLEAALRHDEDEFHALAEKHGAAWAADAAKREEAALAVYAKAVEDLIAARESFGAADALRQFVQAFPKRRHKPTPAAFMGGLLGTNQEPVNVAAFFEALRRDAQREPQAGLQQMPRPVLPGQPEDPVGAAA
jgi:hypothetical protein